MALLITDECISCGACLPECPNEAIFETRSDAETKGNHVGDGRHFGLLHAARGDGRRAEADAAGLER